MVTNVGDIHGGMDVFGLDGQKIGVVADVWLSDRDPETPSIGESIAIQVPAGPDTERAERAREGSDATEDEDDSARIASTRASVSYFQVHGDGTHYYVPFSAVTTLFPGQNVMLDCTEPECARLFGRPPR